MFLDLLDLLVVLDGLVGDHTALVVDTTPELSLPGRHRLTRPFEHILGTLIGSHAKEATGDPCGRT